MNEEDRKRFGWKSEFSMGQLDFERLHEMLKAINHASYMLGQGVYKYMKVLHSLLLTFYDDLRPTLVRSDKAKAEELDKKINDMRNHVAKADRVYNASKNTLSQFYLYNRPPPKIVKETTIELLTLKREILDIKQDVGLGLVLEKMATDRDKLESGLGVG